MGLLYLRRSQKESEYQRRRRVGGGWRLDESDSDTGLIAYSNTHGGHRTLPDPIIEANGTASLGAGGPLYLGVLTEPLQSHSAHCQKQATSLRRHRLAGIGRGLRQLPPLSVYDSPTLTLPRREYMFLLCRR